MRAVLQRVSQASVSVDDQVIGQIDTGLMILLCAMDGDSADIIPKFAAKIAKQRIFPDAAGKMNRSLLDIGGAALIISQFTLSADTKSGNRPSFKNAADPVTGKALYEAFCAELASLGVHVETGQFAAHMDVALVNSGPVTIWMDSQA